MQVTPPHKCKSSANKYLDHVSKEVKQRREQTESFENLEMIYSARRSFSIIQLSARDPPQRCVTHHLQSDKWYIADTPGRMKVYKSRAG